MRRGRGHGRRRGHRHRFGYALAAGADLTGDGNGDLVVGVRIDLSGTYRGRVYVVPGPITGDVRLGASGATITGETDNAWLGARVMVLPGGAGGGGDLLAASAAFGASDYSVSDDGSVYLFEAPLTGSQAPADAVGVLTASGQKDGFGFGLTRLGDQDGDGFADLVITKQADAELFFAGGSARVYDGPVARNKLDTDSDAAFFGETGNVGHALRMPGDITGDGLLDLVVSGTDATGTGSTSGAAYIVPGSR